MTRGFFGWFCFWLCLIATAALADPGVRQRATEEISPGVRVRGGSVIIELDARRCDPPCGEGTECQEVCATALRLPSRRPTTPRQCTGVRGVTQPLPGRSGET